MLDIYKSNRRSVPCIFAISRVHRVRSKEERARTRRDESKAAQSCRRGCSYSGFVTCRFAAQLKDTNL